MDITIPIDQIINSVLLRLAFSVVIAEILTNRANIAAMEQQEQQRQQQQQSGRPNRRRQTYRNPNSSDDLIYETVL